MKLTIESKNGTNYLLVDGVAKVSSKDYFYLLKMKGYVEEKLNDPKK